jgi:acetyl esterase/lipase
MPPRRHLAARIGILSVVPVVAFAVLAGCTATATDEVVAFGTEGAGGSAAQTDANVLSDLAYGAGALDACQPLESDGAPRAAILVIHGGSWTRGDKADEGYRRICRLLAAHGYVAFSVNYRLAPRDIFPAAIDDVTQAVRWLREPAQVDRFNLDPTRIAALGASAGGNLAALLGTRGSGDLTVDARVAAVVELSGPTDLSVPSTEEFTPVQLAYLGCAAAVPCPAAVEASPVSHIDASDPPFFIAHSTAELIPFSQAESFAQNLKAAGVKVELVAVEGSQHSIAMLDDALDQRILDFLAAALAAPDAVT